MKNGRNYPLQGDPSRNPHFQRRWVDDPLGLPGFQHLDREIMPKVLKETGRRAIARWLDLAAHSHGASAARAFKEADAIRQKMGLAWGDLLDHRSAA